VSGVAAGNVQVAPINEPTWTGRFGASGAPGVAARFGATATRRLPADASASEAAPGAEGAAQGNGSHSGARFGGGLAGTTGGVAPRSSVLLAQLRERQAAVSAAASSAARNDPQV
jgi:hypothetical protein